MLITGREKATEKKEEREKIEREREREMYWKLGINKEKQKYTG